MQMHKIFALCLALLIMLAACGQSTQDEKNDELTKSSSVPEFESQAEPQREVTGEITLLTLYTEDWTLAQSLAADFNKTHPNAKVNVEGFASLFNDMDSAEGTADVYQRYVDRLATELMSGEADYILDDSGALDPGKFAGSGLFYDVYQWMDEDPTFDRDAYFQNIFQTAEYDGGLYTLPTTVTMRTVYLNTAILEGLGLSFEPLDTINYKELLQIYADAKAKGLMDEDTPIEYGSTGTSFRYKIFGAEFPDYVDFPSSTATFDSPEFISFLEDTQPVFSAREPEPNTFPSLSVFSEAVHYGETKALLAPSTLSLDTEFSAPLDKAPDGCTGPLILISEKGNVPYDQHLGLSVPKSCTQPELAWEFLKFCISQPENPQAYTTGPDYDGIDISWGGLPVNRQALEVYADLYGTFKGDSDQLMEKLVSVLEKANTTPNGTNSLEEVITPELIKFYDQSLTDAATCAKNIQDTASIYLKE